MVVGNFSKLPTMVFGRKTSFWCVSSIFFAYCLSKHLVLAKKDTQDPTLSPTEAPSVFPSSSPIMSTSPSSLPSTFPSFFPTNNPTISSSKAPTASPTEMPTNTSTNSPSEASAYTPLKTPIIAPPNGALRQTQSPTARLEGGDVYSVLPIITFDVILSEEDVSIEKIQSFFVDFLDGVLEEISVTYGLDYSHLDSNGIISTFNQPRPFDTEYRIRMDGLVYYFDESPTRDSLAQSLNMYFSFWGASDLQNFLMNVGLEKAAVVGISVGGENISFVSNVIQGGSQRAQNNGNAIWNTNHQDETNLSDAAVVMLYTGLVLITVIIALLLFRHRIGRRRLRQDKEFYSRRPSSTTKVSDDGDEENGVRTNKQKTTATKQKGRGSSISSWGKNKPEKRPVGMSKKTPTELLRENGTFESISNAKLTKSKSCQESEKKSDDSKILKQEKYSGNKAPEDGDKKYCDLTMGKLKFTPSKSASVELELKDDDSNTNEEKHNSRVNVPEKYENSCDSETEKQNCLWRDEVSRNLSTDVSLNLYQSSTIITEEPGSSMVLSVNSVRKKSEDVGSDVDTCVLANKNSLQIRRLEDEGQRQQHPSIRKNDTALNLQLGEF